MTPETNVTPSPDVVHTSLQNGEAVLLNIKTRKYFSLNQTGAAIWALLEEGRQPVDIAASLIQRYEVSAEMAASSVDDLLQELMENGLICQKAG